MSLGPLDSPGAGLFAFERDSLAQGATKLRRASGSYSLRIHFISRSDIIRGGLSNILGGSEDIEYSEASELKADLKHIDIIVAESRTLLEAERDLLTAIRARGTKVVVVDREHADAGAHRRLLALGVEGYLPLDASAGELRAAVQAVASGRTYFDLPPTRGRIDSGGAPELTERETAVLELFAKGHTNREVGEVLGTSTRSVGNSLSRIRTKLGLKRRAELVEFALANGFIKPLIPR